jgi:CRISPR/Cas system CSM-associated protein Csm4 (group 5 of RAMP superfamily)
MLPEFRKLTDEIYRRAEVRIRFRDKILAGIPKGGNPLDYFLSMKFQSEQEAEDFKKRIASGQLSEDEKEEIKKTAWCIFERDHEGNLCVWHNNIKSCFKEAALSLGLTQKKHIAYKKEDKDSDVPKTYAGGKHTIQITLHIDPLRVLFERDGKPISKPDGYVDKVKHIDDAAGKRSALGRHDYLDRAEMMFVLSWPKSSTLEDSEVKRTLALCQDEGLGASRSAGNGKFDVIGWKILD